MEMFCIKCKAKRQVDDASVTYDKTAKGRKMARSKCPKCGTKMVKFVK